MNSSFICTMSRTDIMQEVQRKKGVSSLPDHHHRVQGGSLGGGEHPKHPNVGEFDCDKCSSEFETEERLIEHVDIVHKYEDETSSNGGEESMLPNIDVFGLDRNSCELAEATRIFASNKGIT